MPEKALKKLYRALRPEWKVCFFSALLAGVLAHCYKLTEWLPNWDSLVFRYDPQNMLGLGRWFLPVVCAPSSFYDLPFLNGLLAIVFFALGAVIVVAMFGVRKKIPASLIGAFIVTFPTVTSTLMYNYVADGYAIAFFLSVLAAYLLTREKPKYLLAVVCITLSSGIYQAYLTVTAVLVLVHLIRAVVFDRKSLSSVLKQAVGALISAGVGVALYSVVLNLLLSLFSVELSDYQGVNSAVSLTSLDIRSSLYVMKELLLGYFFGGMSVFSVLNGVVFALTAVWYAVALAKTKSVSKILLALLFAILLIPCSVALVFLNPHVDFHNLMRMGFIGFYLPLFLLYEPSPSATRRWVILAVAGLMIANQVVIANVSYHKAQMAYEKSYGVLIRIADRIENTPGATDCDRMLVVGALENSEDYFVQLPPDITGVTDGFIIRADDESVGQSVFTQTLNDYCGCGYEFLYGEEKQALLARDEVSAMGVFPEAGCVAVVDGILVVKLGTEG